MVSNLIDLDPVFRAANGPLRTLTRARRYRVGGRIEAGDGPTRVTAELVAVGRLRAAGAALEYRFGTDAAANALQGVSLGSRLGIVDKIDIIDRFPIRVRPPLPAPPGDTHTALELPWRLLVSPNRHGAFAYSPTEVEHERRRAPGRPADDPGHLGPGLRHPARRARQHRV